MKKKLAILGASYLQLPLVLKVKDMDIETHCFAWKDGAVCEKYADYFYPLSVTDKESILKECQKVNIDGITTIATDLPMTTIAYIAEKLSLCGNSYLSSKLSTNKQLMREAFTKYGCMTPKVYDKNNLKSIEYPCIVKPVDRSGSRGINVVRDSKLLKSAIDEAIENSIAKDFIIEEFVDGDEISVETISWKGAHKIIAITQKITTGEPRFIELAHYQPASLNFDVKMLIEKECIKCLNALKIKNGASHAEFKIGKNGSVNVIEVGARMGGDFIGTHLTTLSSGVDYVRAVIDIALNQFSWEEIIFPKTVKNSGVVYLTKESQDTFNYILHNYKEYIVKNEILNEHLGEIKNSNDRSGYLIYQTENLNLYKNASIHSNNAI